ncbi:MFS general substrate transporter [Polyplosphaeria fusca]|uniref:MFS general substrate transporter n=1 Tax=Polyplosphaeria fusca TaxID=682080 RepID=A0A9P4R005_9PLEO|nr:MFS general substrate transporter [Polyplosphaeria fusca]
MCRASDHLRLFIEVVAIKICGSGVAFSAVRGWCYTIPTIKITQKQRIDNSWTDEEERRLVRKLDCIIPPLLILGFTALQFDRGNMGNAMTDFLLRDVGISQGQFNVGQQLIALSVIVFEIPNNLLFYRFGPKIWLTGQMFAWGSAAAMQALTRGKGFGPYVCLRVVLGLAEAGYSGSGLYTMTMWYKKNETSKRFAVFYVGSAVAHAVSGLMATGILHMRGIAGLTGWQWLFIICGTFTVLAAGIFGLFLPDNPKNPVPYSGIRYFTAQERHILVQRVLLDDPTKFKPHRHIRIKEVKGSLMDLKVLVHMVITIAGHAPSSTMGSYAPSVVRSFGYDRIRSNAITSIGHWCLAINLMLWGIGADRFKRRGPLVSLGLFVWCMFAIGCLAASYHHNKKVRLAVLLCGIAYSTAWHPTNASWVALNAKSPGERSVRMGMMAMASNIGSVVGSQIFQAHDKPRYHRGWAAIASLLAFAFCVSIVANFQYWFLNRRLNKREEGGEVDAGEGVIATGEKWRYSP